MQQIHTTHRACRYSGRARVMNSIKTNSTRNYERLTLHRRTVPKQRARKQCSSIGFAWGAITRGEPCADAEGGWGGRGGTGKGARGVAYKNVKSNMRPHLNGQ